jgi:hypothetical protein
LIKRVIPAHSRAGRAELDRIAGTLADPVRIAVAGRVNSGKSTLVNALLGQQVTPTDVSECTRLVTWFRYGRRQRLEIVLRDGTRRERRLGPGASIPDALGFEVSEIDHLEVWLANDVLRSMTVIDTPGLGSLNAHYSETTEELLAREGSSADAVGQADALVFVMGAAVHADELDVIHSFRLSGAATGPYATNAIGVLGKADQVSSGDDWPEVAGGLAKRLAHKLVDELATVVPVASLLAETAEAAVLNDDDALALEALAQIDPLDEGLLLLSATSFVNEAAPISAQSRQRLLSLLDLRGVRAALSAVRAGTEGATALRRELAGLSGIYGLRAAIFENFRSQGLALKVSASLDALEAACYGADNDADAKALDSLRSQIEQFRLEPVMHHIAEIHAYHRYLRSTLFLPEARALPDTLALPDALAEDLRRFACYEDLAERVGAPSDDRAALREACAAGTNRWRTYVSRAGVAPQARDLAGIVQRSFTLAWNEAA